MTEANLIKKYQPRYNIDLEMIKPTLTLELQMNLIQVLLTRTIVKRWIYILLVLSLSLVI